MKSFALVPLWNGFFFLNMFKAFDKLEISSLPEFLKRNIFIYLMEDIIIKSPQNSRWSDSFFSFAALFIIQSLPSVLNFCLILRYPLHTGQSINGPHPHLILSIRTLFVRKFGYINYGIIHYSISMLRRASLVMCNSARCSFCLGLLSEYNLVSMQSWYVEVFVS